MKNFIIIACVFVTIVIFSAESATISSNPQVERVDTIRRGLIQKLCDNVHGKLKIQSSTTPAAASDTLTITETSKTIKTTTPTGLVEPPSCPDFNNLSFEQLIEKNKALLKSVSTTTTPTKFLS